MSEEKTESELEKYLTRKRNKKEKRLGRR